MSLSRTMAALWVPVAFVMTGCVDLSPLDFEAPEGGVADAGSDALADGPSRDALAAECQECLSSAACASAWDACQGNTECAKFSACMSASLCWASNLTDLSTLSPCLVQCATVGGVTSQNDPAAILISPLYACATDPARCQPECAPGADQ